MDNLSPHKSFPDPGDVRDLPRVLKSTPIPRRETPLPGTKTMLCPKDGHLLEMVSGHPAGETKPSLTATIMGALAIAVALGSNLLFWQLLRSEGSHDRLEAWLFFPGLVIVHLLWMFSRISSNGNERLGCLGVAVLYLGPLVLGIIDSFIR